MIVSRFSIWAAAMAAAVVAGPAVADVTVRIGGVHSATGSVMVALCNDPNGGFPGACMAYSGMAPAKEGEVLVRIPRVPDGRYAVQAFHDENGDFRPQVPAEGVAFGNGSHYPTSYKDAEVAVKGDAEIVLKMDYGSASAQRQARAATLPLPVGVVATDVREGGLYGRLFMPEGSDKRPALILLGGSEGGVDTMSQMATSFAAKGYATLALAYWKVPGLPQTLENIPLEYFDHAVTWLQKQPRVAGGGVGMLGWSRGAEAALLVAVRNPQVRAVIAVAPTSVVWPGMNLGSGAAVPQPAWTVQGKPMPAIALDSRGYSPSQPLATIYTSNFASLDSHPEAVIPAEKVRGGIMLISGGEDHILPSVRFADRIGARLQASRFRHTYVHLSYPAAGHAVFVGAPDSPMARSMTGAEGYLGGNKAANAAAWTDNWPKVLQFLGAELKGDKS